MEDFDFDFGTATEEPATQVAPSYSIDIEKSVSDTADVVEPIELDMDEDILLAVGEDVKVKDTSKSAEFKPKEFKSINQLIREGHSKEEAIDIVNERRSATAGTQLRELGRQVSLGMSKTALGIGRLATTPYEILTGDSVESLNNLEKSVKEEESYFTDKYGVNIPDIVNKANYLAPAIAGAPAMMAGLNLGTVATSGVGSAVKSLITTPKSLLGAASRGSATGGSFAFSNYASPSEAYLAASLSAAISAGIYLAPAILPTVGRILAKSKLDMDEQAIYDLKKFANISDDEADRLVTEYRKFVDTSKLYKEEEQLLSLLHVQDKTAVEKVVSLDKEAASVVRVFLDDQLNSFKVKIGSADPTIAIDSVKYFKDYVKTTDKIIQGMTRQLDDIPVTSYSWKMADIIKSNKVNELLSRVEFTPKISKLLTDSRNIGITRSKSLLDERLTASDLFSFRNSLEEYRFNNLDKLTATEKEVLSTLFKETNYKISTMAKSSLADPNKFISAWRAALISKRETLELTKNKLFRDITSEGLSEDQIISKYTKYINSADSTFSSVIAKLPVNGVKKIESAIVAKAFEQYSSKGVIDFIGLDKSLSKATLRTAEAREKQLLISEAARVFRNNPELKEASDKLLLDNAHTAILTDAFNIVWSRLNNMVGKWIYSYVPTQEGRKLNAFRKLDSVLDRPESIQAVRELKATIPKEEHKEIDELVASLRQHQAQRKYLQQISGGNNGKTR